MQQYEVSRNTVRLALGLLRDEGLIFTGQGRGSFVAEGRRRYRAATRRSARPLAGHPDDALIADFAEPGRAEQMEISVARTPAPLPIADRLAIEPGTPVVERRRVLYLESRPNQTADSYFPAELVADSAIMAPALLEHGVDQVLRELGHPVARHVDEVTVRMPLPAEAQTLQIAAGVPVMAVLRTAYDNEDQPVATSVSILPGDRHALVYEVGAD